MAFSASAVIGAVMVAGAAAVLAPQPAAAAAGKEPPKCAAISFRPIPSGTPDGEQDTGMYRSRFGKIEIKATVQGGAAKNYYMVLNGKPVTAGPAPKVSNACLTSKNVAVPYKNQPAGACTGERFRVVIDRSGAKPVALFFGLHGSAWEYCSGTDVPEK
ncbi:hypothetical protein M2352_000300 [Azospirillum fermentarium]|uniref:hypothetical protein n=1 Tax=Azospirillum fermentarium TaxID=1233114 RepID=UPI0022269533|nr:hypothetical protein [Azospirillum fermentarium]MCW2244709.1 hypothetical protein [Azospirillum fermentarium]